MTALRTLAATAILGMMTTPALAAPVLVISIDGLRPADVLDADKRGIKVPTLSGLVAQGVYATGVRNALPTVTYPNHTTLLTGVWPARHGIANNTVFDPLKKNQDGWYWYAGDIKVKTLWDAVHESHGTVAALSWPVSVGATSIDYDVPEYWRARNVEDVKLLRALSTPGLVGELEKDTGLKLADAYGETPAADDARARLTGALIGDKHPQLVTLHLASLDHTQHEAGPGTAAAVAVLEKLDGTVGRLIVEARKAQPDLVVAIVSDHGFAPVDHDVNILKAFVDAGLITLDAKSGKPVAWEAAPWGGASAAVVLARPDDATLKARVKALLDKLAADPDYGIDHVADAAEVAKMGGTPDATFWIDFTPGFEMGQNPSAAKVAAGSVKGTHGYFPTHPEMRATFIIAGPGIPAKGSLGDIDMRDIAPTLAEVLHVSLPDAEGKPLF